MSADAERTLRIEVCRKHGAEPHPVLPDQKVGIARNVRDGVMPIHGVRSLPERGTTGWYIWAGECSDDPGFFVPVHVAHLSCQVSGTIR